MPRLNNRRHRKPDFLLVLVTVVGVALAATLTLHVHALSSTSVPDTEQMLSQLKR